MNIKPLLLSALPAVLAVATFAQTPTPPATAPAPAATTGTQTAAPAEVPKMKIGIINIAAFKEYIGEMRQRYEKLQAEFAPIGNELEAMQSKIAAQQQVLQEKGPSMTAPQARKLNDDIEDLQRQFKRKQEDAQAQARKREEEETGPIFDKINQFMIQYAQKHGLTMVLEVSGIGQALIYASPEANITEDFIMEYNKAYPVPAAAASTAPSPAAGKPAGTTPAKPVPAPAKPAPGRKPGR
jgi:outer membrane protein